MSGAPQAPAAARVGMVYVATRRPDYVAEAFLLGHSARDYWPGLPRTLYTDLPFARSPCFDQIVPLSPGNRYRSVWAEGQPERIRAQRWPPQETTLNLDKDRRVLTPTLPDLFRRLDDVDIAMAI